MDLEEGGGNEKVETLSALYAKDPRQREKGEREDK